MRLKWHGSINNVRIPTFMWTISLRNAGRCVRRNNGELLRNPQHTASGLSDVWRLVLTSTRIWGRWCVWRGCWCERWHTNTQEGFYILHIWMVLQSSVVRGEKWHDHAVMGSNAGKEKFLNTSLKDEKSLLISRKRSEQDKRSRIRH